ncbi:MULTISPECIES: SpoIID/LytB domain-containing protein [unclassified Knoellia]|uniref:SpoIID/LytB domain-containing protein n=1 Tax=Knoellia altitudinis TaxID=3404795 RepID=UPI00361F585B
MTRLISVAAAAILLAAPMTAAASTSSAVVRDSTTRPAQAARAAVSEAPVADTLATRPGPDSSRTATAPTAAAGAAATAPVVGLTGRGFGHGRGMSQWGARGAASQGRTVAQILDFYYPGTTTASIGNPEVRVRLTAMGSGATVVAGEAGLTLTDGTCTTSLTPSNAVSWRTSRTTAGWKVEGYYTKSSGSTGWWPLASACSGFVTARHLTFVGDGSLAASVLTLRTPSGNRAYRGGLRATPVTLRGGTTVNTFATVNVLAMDNYLRSVVPAEMPASWALEAVKAQAVAARSYTGARLGSPDGFDICDTTSCQVYPGLTSSNPEHPNSDAAVKATSGQVRKYGTAIAMTEFSSTNGGQVVGTSVPYQVAKADPYDGVYAEAPDTWSYLTMPVTAIENAWPSIGTFRSMTFSRDARGAFFGGRATSVVLTGSAGTRSVGAETFRGTLNLRSTWFIPVGSSVGTDFAGNAFSDLIARDASGNLWNYHGNGRGGLLPRTAIATGFPASPEIVAPGDFSGDGMPDLLTRSAAGTLTLHKGDGTGRIVSSSSISGGWQGFDTVLAPGDLDGDGHVDLLARDTSGTLWLHRSNGAGTLLPKVSKGSGWQDYRELDAVGDFDADGGADLVGSHRTGALHLLRFSASGTYLGKRHVTWGSFTALSGPGDFNGDRRTDVFTRDSGGRLWVHLGDGTGGVSSRVQIGSGWQAMSFAS